MCIKFSPSLLGAFFSRELLGSERVPERKQGHPDVAASCQTEQPLVQPLYSQHITGLKQLQNTAGGNSCFPNLCSISCQTNMGPQETVDLLMF